ncbi:hypothetical protein QTP86_010900 [Hemibagrus guttatus]|nr:hypothetical protein QTP86_010900 [Hemibagrus guttatus]
MIFADDIVICSESREQVEENLERWRFALERRGMKVSRSKTEYMCVNEREGSGKVRLQGEEVKKVQEFKYLGSTVQSNGECGKEDMADINTLKAIEGTTVGIYVARGTSSSDYSDVGMSQNKTMKNGSKKSSSATSCKTYSRGKLGERVLCTLKEFREYMRYRETFNLSCEKHLLEEQMSQNKTMKNGSKKSSSATSCKTYSRGKLGERIFETTKGFSLADPNTKLMDMQYNNLHDPHLKHFFNRRGKKQRLKKLGLITNDNKVLCTLKEFREYMRYRETFNLSCEKHLLEEQMSQNKTMKNGSKKSSSATSCKTYSRGKLGERIFETTKGFSLADPNTKLMDMQYNNLHDPHLKHFFNWRGKKQRLKKLGLITNDNKVLCTLKEFREYMRYRETFNLSCEKHLLEEQKQLLKKFMMLKQKGEIPDISISDMNDWLIRKGMDTFRKM